MAPAWFEPAGAPEFEDLAIFALRRSCSGVLAMFDLAIDSKLRACDVVALKFEDVAPNGYAVDRATVRQKKTGQPVRFELTEQTRQAVDEYLRASTKKPGEFLFSGRTCSARLVTAGF